jgi:hypothetical protein
MRTERTTKHWAVRALPVAILAIAALLGTGQSAQVATASKPSGLPSAVSSAVPVFPGAASSADPTPTPAAKPDAVTQGAAISPTAAATPAAVTQKVYVSVDDVTASTKDNTNTDLDSSADITAFIAKMNAYWSGQSGGQVNIVLGGIEHRSLNQSTCNYSQVFSSVPGVAFDGLFAGNRWEGSNNHLLMLTREACGNAGYGTIGGGSGGLMFAGTGLNGIYALPTAVHEFGHNLTFNHAGSEYCLSSSSFDSTQANIAIGSKTCPVDEYGDFLDIMGYTMSNAVPGLSSPQRILAGYMSDYSVVSAPGAPQTFTIKPLSGNGASGIRAVEVKDPNGATYYVEYRTDSGQDASSSEWKYTSDCGAIASGYDRCRFGGSKTSGELRVLRFYNPNDSHTGVIAAGETSAKSSKRREDFLPVGQSFTDAGGKFILSVKSTSASSGAVVTLTIAGKQATHTSLTTSSPTQTYDGTASVYTSTVAPVTGGVPAGSTAFYSGSTKLATVPDNANGVASYRVTKTASVGKHSIHSTFTPSSSTFCGSSSSTASVLTVSKAAATVSFSLRYSSVHRSGHEYATVTISVPGVTSPNGKVYLYIGSSHKVTHTITSSNKGHFTMTVPKISSTGGKTLTIRYLGSEEIASAAQVSKNFTVIR